MVSGIGENSADSWYCTRPVSLRGLPGTRLWGGRIRAIWTDVRVFPPERIHDVPGARPHVSEQEHTHSSDQQSESTPKSHTFEVTMWHLSVINEISRIPRFYVRARRKFVSLYVDRDHFQNSNFTTLCQIYIITGFRSKSSVLAVDHEQASNVHMA